MKALLAGLMAAFLVTFSAAAIETGTPAWTDKPVAIKSGPGEVYEVIGEIAGPQRIRVERCYKLWCLIRANGQKGWALEQYLSFGHEPKHHLLANGLHLERGGEVCLFSGPNYTGTAICGGPGLASRDLALRGFDNTISSVQINGSGAVTLCRDRFFHSYCERIQESQPRINGFLNDSVSAFHIH